jgi:tetratricopeptide (TPR) repeat protein
MRILRLLPVLAVVAAVAAGCAPRTAPPVVAPAAPRHPEFIFPEPDTVVPQQVLDEHKAAWNLLQSGDTRAAERRFNTVIKRTTLFYPAETGLGYAALAREDHDEAIKRFDRALGSNPRYAPALAGRGQTYFAMGDRDRALASFDAALAADPSLTGIRSAADVLRVQGLQGGVVGARRAAQEGRLAEARAGYQQAIVASPQSPFLYRELADIERRDGNLVAALEQVQKAITLDASEPRSFVLLADIYEAMGDYVKAADALGSAAALEPSDTLTDRMEALRAKASFNAMPDEFKAIESAETITRAQLAALIGNRLDALVRRAPRATTAVITDIRGSWAQPWIISTTRAGFMEVYPNHTFLPGATVRRADLALTASRILSFVAAENPAHGAAWRNARLKFPDVPAGHLAHPAASMAVEAGVIRPLEGGAFGLTRPVTGAEAVAAVTRLLEIAGGPQPARPARR